MKTGHKSKKDGFFLISIAIAFVLVTILAFAIVKMTTTSTYNRVLAGNSNRAYCLAESGAEYAVTRFIKDRIDVSGSYQLLDNSGSFVIAGNTNSDPIVFTCVGIIHPNTALEARRKVTFELGNPGANEYQTSFGDKNDLDDWTLGDGHKADIWKDVLRVQSENKIFEVGLSLDWQEIPELDLLSSWQNAGQLLNYDVQVKIAALPNGNKGDHFMMGISFRLNTDAAERYGVSYFFSDPAEETPAWMDYSVFGNVRTATPQILLWKESSGQFTLLDHRELTESHNVVGPANKVDVYLKPWSTLLLSLEEVFDQNGNRQNRISVFVQGTDVYGPGSDMIWDQSQFSAAGWAGGNQPILDSTFTSEDFDTELPEEIGLHSFYDSPANNDMYFDDFGIRVNPEEQPWDDIIQY
ncbi:MAG: hypothetical protein E4H02_08025 [Lentisphaerales bacterium]|nr:MAG: hypothetical protein E4H02_08025 [Lentisphaerales bacterium]